MNMYTLTKREAEVAQMLATGMFTKQVASSLGITEHTVRNYVAHIYNKTGASNRVELTLLVLTEERLASF